MEQSPQYRFAADALRADSIEQVMANNNDGSDCTYDCNWKPL